MGSRPSSMKLTVSQSLAFSVSSSEKWARWFLGTLPGPLQGRHQGRGLSPWLHQLVTFPGVKSFSPWMVSLSTG